MGDLLQGSVQLWERLKKSEKLLNQCLMVDPKLVWASWACDSDEDLEPEYREQDKLNSHLFLTASTFNRRVTCCRSWLPLPVGGSCPYPEISEVERGDRLGAGGSGAGLWPRGHREGDSTSSSVC